MKIYHSRRGRPYPCWEFIPHNESHPIVNVWLGTDRAEVIPVNGGRHVDILITDEMIDRQRAELLLGKHLGGKVVVKGRLK
jgi:hypothetical protein